MSSVRIVMQCRLSSLRLPAKALWPLAGVPSVILAARRAMNTELPFTIATSIDPSDDLLSEILMRLRIPTVRGPLDDVLKRFELACADLSEDALVVRLTADNPVPDGALIAELISEQRRRKTSYLSIWSPVDETPFGLSAEIFSVSALREAAQHATERYDREHVTPWMIRKYGHMHFRPSWIEADLSHLRCTLDTFTDYLRLVRLFEGVADPFDATAPALCEKLLQIDGESRFRIPYKVIGNTIHGEMVLGTAQLGMAYGIANRSGMPHEEEAARIIETAVGHGVTHLDTAAGYGESEKRIGKALAGDLHGCAVAITKLETLDALLPETPPDEVEARVERSVFRSCRDLRLTMLPVLLLHRWEHRKAWGGSVWKTILKLKAEKVIQNIGASVYSPEEACEALEEPDITYLQLPFNLLDWRWHAPAWLKKIKTRSDVVIHARSVLLQGLLAGENGAWPKGFSSLGTGILSQMDGWVETLQRKSRVDLCIAYARAQPWITGLVIGVETLAQLHCNLSLFKESRLSALQCEKIRKELQKVPETVLDPRHW